MLVEWKFVIKSENWFGVGMKKDMSGLYLSVVCMSRRNEPSATIKASITVSMHRHYST